MGVPSGGCFKIIRQRFYMMQNLSTDVLIIGAGAAGIRAAMSACREAVQVVIVAAQAPTHGGATFSEISKGWGIQALVGRERTAKRLQDFYDDIMRVGLGRCDPRLVRILVEESGPRLEELVACGLEFKKGSSGEPIRARGCFSDAERAFLTRDMGNIRRTFLSILRRLSVRMVTGEALELIVHERECQGAWVGLQSGEFIKINANATILATGGGTEIFKNHLGSGGAAGSGHALAWLAGAEMINMEFAQFALGLQNNGTRKFLPIGQLERAEKIVNPSGCDILKYWLPDDRQRREALEKRQQHMPFSCRDESGMVDMAVAAARQSDKKLYWCRDQTEKRRYEVVHFAHAFNGGIRINERAESTIAGLYAAGEVAAGSHGADRIGGCMMTATQVFGHRAGHYAARRAIRMERYDADSGGTKKMPNHPAGIVSEDVITALAMIEKRIKQAMEQYVGVLRTQKGLKKARSILDTCQNQLGALEFMGAAAGRGYYRVRNMVITAQLVAQSALAHGKSMGSHYRQDDSRSFQRPEPRQERHFPLLRKINEFIG